jgi:Fic family protein
MRYLPEELINELNQKCYFIKNQEKYDLNRQCRKIASKRIAKNAQIQSYEIENPHSRIPFSISRNNKKKIIHEGIKNIERAFVWGIVNFNPSEFNESFIRELAGRVTPELYFGQIAQYRRDNVRITGAHKIPPSPYKVTEREIPWFVASIKEQLSTEKIIDKIESSIFAHYHLTRIHPFDDGNGRTARLLQSIILNHFGIPSPLIEPGERFLYYSCLEKADLGWEEKSAFDLKGVSEGEKLFYTFIAGKINASLDQLISRCKT